MGVTQFFLEAVNPKKVYKPQNSEVTSNTNTKHAVYFQTNGDYFQTNYDYDPINDLQATKDGTNPQTPSPYMHPGHQRDQRKRLNYHGAAGFRLNWLRLRLWMAQNATYALRAKL